VTEKEKNELAKYVLTAAIVYLSLNIKWKEVLVRLGLRNEDSVENTNSFYDRMWSDSRFTSYGVEYQDVRMGSSAVTTDRLYVLKYKVFYNGLEVMSGEPTIKPLGQVDNFSTCIEGLIPFKDAAIVGAVVGMGVGGRRKIAVVPEKGFGDGGFPPFVPAGATVVLDVTLS
jgi:FKBP-type peptidyl-prolyl cis-trans isomerase